MQLNKYLLILTLGLLATSRVNSQDGSAGSQLVGKTLKESLFEVDSDVVNCKRQMVEALESEDAEVLSKNFDKLANTTYKENMEGKDKDALNVVTVMAKSCKSLECRSIIAGLGKAKDCRKVLRKELKESSSDLSYSRLEAMLTDKYADCREKIQSALELKELKVGSYFFEEKSSDDSSGPGKKVVDACGSSECQMNAGKLKNPKACKEKLVAARGGEREFKIDINVPVECTTEYFFEESGEVTIKTDSPDISDKFKETKSVDDDGYIALAALLNTMRDTKADANGDVIVPNQDIALMKAAIKRSIDYAKTYESQTDDRDILATFKRQVAFGEEMLKYIDERPDGKFSQEKINELGAFLEQDKDFHGYTINNSSDLFGVCQEYGAVPRCCDAGEPQWNNVLAKTLCQKNLATGAPNKDVFRYGETMCASNKIVLSSPESQSAPSGSNESNTAPKY